MTVGYGHRCTRPITSNGQKSSSDAPVVVLEQFTAPFPRLDGGVVKKTVRPVKAGVFSGRQTERASSRSTFPRRRRPVRGEKGEGRD
jgi:hypothetical protein